MKNILLSFYRGTLLSFYRGTRKNSEGRYLKDILAWDYQHLENEHDYIQWLFPKKKPSRFNPSGPILSNEDIKAFREDPLLRAALLNSFRVMLGFYGFTLSQSPRNQIEILRSQRAPERFEAWVRSGNHNYERITRILVSLRTLACGEYAQAFMSALEELYSTDLGRRMDRESIGYWRRAAGTEERERGAHSEDRGSCNGVEQLQRKQLEHTQAYNYPPPTLEENDMSEIAATPTPLPQISPFEFLQGFDGAPTQEQLDGWKSQAPGGRIRLFHSTDGKRVYLLRGIGGQELAQMQALISANTAQDRLANELQTAISIRCCVWTSVSPDHKLSDLLMRASGAGLPQTLHEIVCQLSDYLDAESIDRYSADL